MKIDKHEEIMSEFAKCRESLRKINDNVSFPLMSFWIILWLGIFPTVSIIGALILFAR